MKSVRSGCCSDQRSFPLKQQPRRSNGQYLPSVAILVGGNIRHRTCERRQFNNAISREFRGTPQTDFPGSSRIALCRRGRMAGTIRERDAGQKTAARIRSILASRGLTLHQVSAESERLYGSESPSCIPHTLYHSLAESPFFGPSIAQICALSRISGYRIEDWLAALGIDLGIVSRAPGRTASEAHQTGRSRLRSCRTSAMGGPEEPRGSVASRTGSSLWGNCFGGSNGRNLQRSQSARPTRHSLFAKIGPGGRFCFSGVAARQYRSGEPGVDGLASRSMRHGSRPPLLLIEHERGLWCGRFHVAPMDGLSCLGLGTLVLRRSRSSVRRKQRSLAWSTWRSAGSIVSRAQGTRGICLVSPGSAATGTRGPRGPHPPGQKSSSGLTLHEACLFSRQVSQFLNDQQFAIAQSTLSEYEVQHPALDTSKRR